MTAPGESPAELADRLEHWIRFFDGEDFEGLTVVADLHAAVAYLRRLDTAEKPYRCGHTTCSICGTSTPGAEDQS